MFGGGVAQEIGVLFSGGKSFLAHEHPGTQLQMSPETPIHLQISIDGSRWEL